MMRPIARNTTQFYTQNKQESKKTDGEDGVNQIQSSIANSVEELAMARSLYQSKNKKLGSESSQELELLLQGDAETNESLTKVLSSGEITKESLTQVLLQLKSDVGKYQLLRYLLTNADISAAVYQFIFEEIEKLKRKRKKLSSLDNLVSENSETNDKDAISSIELQEIFLSFLEYQGHIAPYFDEVYKKSKKKYKKIIKFISKMLNYEVFALTVKDDLDAFIYLTEKRRDLNMLNDVYEALDEMNKFDNLDFVHSLLINVEVEEFCDTLSSEQVSMLVTFFNRVPQPLFFSPEDKEEVLGTMRNNVTYRFKRQWN